MDIDSVFEVFPNLTTERYILRKIKLNDAPQLYSYFSLHKVMEFYDVEVMSSEEQAIELIDQLLLSYTAGKQIRWAIADKDTNKLIGTCGFHAIEREHFKSEIGYDLHPYYWGMGVMTEVIAKVIDFGFTKMGLNRIEAFYHPKNKASSRVLEKNGFQFEGILKRRFFIKGEFLDTAIASIIKDTK